jgi:hypothetical protein
MKEGEKGYILGFMTFALGMFFGSKWSPDYMEMVSNGNNFLIFVGFGLIILILFSFIDYYSDKNFTKQNKNETN